MVQLFSRPPVLLPRGLIGRLYWYVLFTFHLAIFGILARRLARIAEKRTVGILVDE